MLPIKKNWCFTSNILASLCTGILRVWSYSSRFATRIVREDEVRINVIYTCLYLSEWPNHSVCMQSSKHNLVPQSSERAVKLLENTISQSAMQWVVQASEHKFMSLDTFFRVKMTQIETRTFQNCRLFLIYFDLLNIKTYSLRAWLDQKDNISYSLYNTDSSSIWTGQRCMWF